MIITFENLTKESGPGRLTTGLHVSSSYTTQTVTVRVKCSIASAYHYYTWRVLHRVKFYACIHSNSVQPNPVDQDKLFGRISDTFVCMLETSGLVKFKGGVFQVSIIWELLGFKLVVIALPSTVYRVISAM